MCAGMVLISMAMTGRAMGAMDTTKTDTVSCYSRYMMLGTSFLGLCLRAVTFVPAHWLSSHCARVVSARAGAGNLALMLLSMCQRLQTHTVTTGAAVSAASQANQATTAIGVIRTMKITTMIMT